jgi:spermidine synthase
LIEDDQKYDLIVVDVYHETEVPPPFHSREFVAQLKKHLQENACVVFNKVVNNQKHFDEYLTLKTEMEKVFKRVVIIQALGLNKVLIAED